MGWCSPYMSDLCCYLCLFKVMICSVPHVLGVTISWMCYSSWQVIPANFSNWVFTFKIMYWYAQFVPFLCAGDFIRRHSEIMSKKGGNAQLQVSFVSCIWNLLWSASYFFSHLKCNCVANSSLVKYHFMEKWKNTDVLFSFLGKLHKNMKTIFVMFQNHNFSLMWNRASL